MKNFLKYSLACCAFLGATIVFADIMVPMYRVAENGQNQAIGTVTISQNKYGLLFTPHLAGLTPGMHGFHLHQNASCEHKAEAAGGHLDPHNTSKHLGPYSDNGHLGDLPALYVAVDGTATLPVLAPRLKDLSEVQHHALMIHAGGDNYSDSPQKLGGGGARVACGAIN